MIAASDLHGVWHLVDFQIRFSDGRDPFVPFGGEPRGQIIYDPSGYMSAVLWGAGRAELDVDRLENARRAPLEQKAAAFDSYLSYGGTFHVDGDEVVHSVQHSLLQDTVGLEQRRSIRFDTDLLILSYQITPDSGVTRTYELTWRRPS